MKVKFLEDVIIRDELSIDKGEVYEAYESGHFIMIVMPDGSTVKAPKSEINGILEISEED